MEQEKLRIEIGGAEPAELYDDLVSVEVELDDELAGMARVSLVALQRDDGTWPYLDDDRFRLWQPLTVTAGLGDAKETLLHGYITHLRPDFAGVPDQCLLEVWAMDTSVLMDRRDVLKDWPNRKDSDIAREIFATYGLNPEVTDTAVIHDEDVSTIIQGETDIRFLKRLSRRNGFECHVSGDTGYFGPPTLAGTPQPVLSVLCGEETNVSQFAVQVEAIGPSPVAMAQIDRTTKELLNVTVDSTTRKSLGAQSAEAFLATGMKSAVVHLNQSVATGRAEMEALCQSVHDGSEWFVTGEGEVAANYYGTILMPRRTVTIKGIGETYSGVYYVTRVTHVFTTDGYTQAFTVKRNALKPNGTEKFTDGGALLPGLPI